MKFTFPKLFLVFLSVSMISLKADHSRTQYSNNGYPREYSSYSYSQQKTYGPTDQLFDAAIGVGAIVGVVGATYLTGLFWQWALFVMAQNRYAPEMDLLARASYNQAFYENEDAIRKELIKYILFRHDKINSSFFWSNGSYKNYPLLKYKKDLDFYINSLWLLSIFYAGSEKAQEITRFREKLERLRDMIVTDYSGFIEEQRDYDNYQRKEELRKA